MDQTLRIRPLRALPEGIEAPRTEAAVESFCFVDNLIGEWCCGANRFAQPGEVFLGAFRAAERSGLVGREHRSAEKPRRMAGAVEFLPNLRCLSARFETSICASACRTGGRAAGAIVPAVGSRPAIFWLNMYYSSLWHEYEAPMIDWSKFPDVEQIDGKVGGAWLVKGTRLPVWAIMNHADEYTPDEIATEIFEGVAADVIRRIIDFARQHEPASS